MIGLWNIHVLSNLLLIYICKLHGLVTLRSQSYKSTLFSPIISPSPNKSQSLGYNFRLSYPSFFFFFNLSQVWVQVWVTKSEFGAVPSRGCEKATQQRIWFSSSRWPYSFYIWNVCQWCELYRSFRPSRICNTYLTGFHPYSECSCFSTRWCESSVTISG